MENLLNLKELINRNKKPVPWDNNCQMPWNNHDFSTQVLKEHLSQEHDVLTRRMRIVKKQINWIHNYLLLEKTSKVLDLACGPGIYTNMLSEYGHKCVGIDFSPASIKYARSKSKEGKLDSEFIENDIRNVEYPGGCNLAMLTFGDFNTFAIPDAKMVLGKIRSCLKPGGKLLLEPLRFESVKSMGCKDAIWYTCPHGVFSNREYLSLEESVWYEEQNISIIEYYILDSNFRNIRKYNQTYQAYSNDEYVSLLSKCGFKNIVFYESMTNLETDFSGSLICIIAEV